MNSNKPRISTVVAIGQKDRAIGNGNKLLWHIPEDLKRFKEITMGHPVIMGRKTFESILAILGKPLPGRKNIVITNQRDYPSHGADIINSLEAALALAEKEEDKEIFIGGGQQIYEQALPYIDRLYLTLVDSDKEGDTFFPPYENIFTKEICKEERSYNGLNYTWLTLEK